MPINVSGLTPNEFFVIFWYWFWTDAMPEFKLFVKICLVMSALLVVFGNWKERKFFGVHTLILVAFTFNHYTMFYLSKYFGLSSRYFRYTWIIPIMPVFAYFVTKIVLHWNNRYTRIIAFGLSICALWYGGKELKQATYRLFTGLAGNSGMETVDNIYKIEQDSKDVADIIEKDKKDKSKEVKVLYNYELAMDIRTYDASFLSDYVLSEHNSMRNRIIDQGMIDGYVNNLDYRGLLVALTNLNPGINNPAPIVSTDVIMLALENCGIEYIVIRNDSKYTGQLVECGELLGVTKNYHVIRRN